MYNAELLIQKLMSYYNVFTISELANKIGVSQPSISGWKRHNYVKAIANKCRELGIYNEIFGNFDLNRNIQKIDQISGGNNSQLNFGNQINNVNNEISGVDKLTLDILKDAYQKAIENDDLKGLRIHLMEYS